MREFSRRLVVPIGCFALVLAAGYPAVVSGLTPPLEAAGTGIALLAVATALRRTALVQASRGAHAVRDLRHETPL